MTEKKTCPTCGGNGWYVGHDPDDLRPEHFNDGDCITCPVQILCEDCRGTGLIEK